MILSIFRHPSTLEMGKDSSSLPPNKQRVFSFFEKSLHFWKLGRPDFIYLHLCSSPLLHLRKDHGSNSSCTSLLDVGKWWCSNVTGSLNFICVHTMYHFHSSGRLAASLHVVILTKTDLSSSNSIFSFGIPRTQQKLIFCWDYCLLSFLSFSLSLFFFFLYTDYTCTRSSLGCQ